MTNEGTVLNLYFLDAGDDPMTLKFPYADDEALRRAWDEAVIVNSAMRCVEHNKAVGGAARSRHLIGCAVDIRPGDDDFMSFADLVVRMAGTSDEGWEIIVYREKGFVHVGVPRECALKLWNRSC